jgi:hypothetical protein
MRGLSMLAGAAELAAYVRARGDRPPRPSPLSVANLLG